jgi:ribosome recycling factor
MIEETLRSIELKFRKAIESLQSDLANIHTGRASVSLVDSILVDLYGTKTPIKAIANITVTDPRSIVIQPWDKSSISQIESAIRESDLKLNPVNSGENVRINLPELTEERRKEFVKIAREKAENAKISVRSNRADAANEIKKAKAAGVIGEDEMYRGEQELLKIVDRYNKR